MSGNGDPNDVGNVRQISERVRGQPNRVVWVCRSRIGRGLTLKLIETHTGFLIDFRSCIPDRDHVGDIPANRDSGGRPESNALAIRPEEKAIRWDKRVDEGKAVTG